MRGLLSGLLATCLVASLVHCSSAERQTFDDDDAGAAETSSSGSVADPGPSITSDGGTVDSGPRVCTEDIDVVLVIDTSSSMNFVLDALKSEFEGVVSASNELKSGAHFGAVFFQDNALLDSTGDEEGGKVHLSSASLESAFATMKSVYTANNRNPADGPSGPTFQNPICEENALDALELAATAFPWRDNAAHIIVVVTDDTFLESPDNYGDGNGDGDTTDTLVLYPEGDYPATSTVGGAVAALQAKNIKVFSFTRVAHFERNECGTPRRFKTEGDEAAAFGWSAPYDGAAPIPEQTGGASYDLDEVKDGDLHLGDAINGIVLGVHCSEVN